MFNYNTLQLSNKAITITSCVQSFFYNGGSKGRLRY